MPALFLERLHEVMYELHLDFPTLLVVVVLDLGSHLIFILLDKVLQLPNRLTRY